MGKIKEFETCFCEILDELHILITEKAEPFQTRKYCLDLSFIPMAGNPLSAHFLAACNPRPALPTHQEDSSDCCGQRSN